MLATLRPGCDAAEPTTQKWLRLKINPENIRHCVAFMIAGPRNHEEQRLRRYASAPLLFLAIGYLTNLGIGISRW